MWKDAKDTRNSACLHLLHSAFIQVFGQRAHGWQLVFQPGQQAGAILHSALRPSRVRQFMRLDFSPFPDHFFGRFEMTLHVWIRLPGEGPLGAEGLLNNGGLKVSLRQRKQ